MTTVASTSASSASGVPELRVRRWDRTSVVGTAVLALAGLVLLAGPYLFDVGTMSQLVELFVYIIIAAMWNLLAGYGGMLSIGQQAYIGLGAYGIVGIADLLGVNPFLSIPLAAIACGIVAIPISYLAFRLVGGYFAIGTWVIAEVIRLIVGQVPAFGAGAGYSLRSLSGMDRSLRISLVFWAALVVLIAIVVACVLFARSRRGLALTAVRDDPVSAATSGVAVQSSKRVVFVAAAMGTGAAGAILALQNLRVQPTAMFDVQWSAYMIFIVIIGGLGTLEGPILGAIVFFVLREVLSPYGPLYLIVLGVVGIAFVLFARKGIWGLISARRPVSLFSTGYRVTGLEAARGRAGGS